jgi:hypothetical protein
MSRPQHLAIIDRGGAGLAARRQCALPGLARSGAYRTPPSPAPEELALMRWIDRQYLPTPLYSLPRRRCLVPEDWRDGARLLQAVCLLRERVSRGGAARPGSPQEGPARPRREIGGSAWSPTMRLAASCRLKTISLARWPRSLSGCSACAGHYRVEECEDVVRLRFENVASLIGEHDPGLFASSPKVRGGTQPRGVVQGSGAHVEK